MEEQIKMSLTPSSLREPLLSITDEDRTTKEDQASISVIADTLLPFLSTRAVLVVIGLLTTFYIMPLMVNNPVLPGHADYIRFPEAFWLMWQHFDSGFYLDIAQHGYWAASTLHSTSNWAFYPLFPFLVSCVGFLFGGSYNALSLAGLLISNIAAIIALLYLYLLIHKEFGRQTASRTILYLLLFPTCFYLSAIYPESLFLALAIASIYYARRQSWWLAGFCGGLAALSRSQGIMLLVPIGWEFIRVTSNRYAPQIETQANSWQEQRMIELKTGIRGLGLAVRKVNNWFSAASLLLIPAGLFTFMLYAKIKTGDWLATFHTEQWGWGKQLSYPWRLLIFSLRHPIIGEPLNWNFWVFNIVTAFVFLGFVVWAFRRLPMIYAFYTAVMVILPLSANLLNSVGRYYLIVFPAFMLLALWSSNKKQWFHFTMIYALAALQTIFMILYVLGVPAIA